MADDRSKVFDDNADAKAFLDTETAKVPWLKGDGGVNGLLKDLCILLGASQGNVIALQSHLVRVELSLYSS
jgi:hypothetical protein